MGGKVTENISMAAIDIYQQRRKMFYGGGAPIFFKDSEFNF